MLQRAAILFLIGLSALSLPARAQGEHQEHAAEKLGEVFFPVSCSPAVQESFNHSVALLHSFTYAASEKAFLEIASADPKCAMAHWGAAMSYYHQLWEPPISAADQRLGQLEIQKAEELGGDSAREQAFIHALALFYKDAQRVPYETRARAYEEAMGALAARNPKDAESQIFYALAVVATASPSDHSHSHQKHAAQILEPLFRRYPQHPGIAHYLIHAYDNPELAALGLPAARDYAQIAPSNPHALHMPSHIFTLRGLWQDSIHANSAARAAAHQQGELGEEVHSMDYLMYAYLQAGENDKASQLLQELNSMSQLPVSQFKVGYAATAMPVRFAVERGEWALAAAIPPREGSPPQVLAIAYWCHALALARDGKKESAEPELEKLRQALVKVREGGDDYWAAQIEIQILEAKAWIAHSAGKAGDAVSLLSAAAEKEDGLEKRPITPGPIVPAREQLGDLLLELNRPGEAMREFDASLKQAPRRRGALTGAAHSAELAGDQAKADQYKKDLRTISTAAID